MIKVLLAIRSFIRWVSSVNDKIIKRAVNNIDANDNKSKLIIDLIIFGYSVEDLIKNTKYSKEQIYSLLKS